jgi:ketosteroid isomerase-like protein
MSDFQAIADRVEIEALRGEAADAAMMRDADRLASLFTPDGVLLMPNIPAEFHGQEEIRAGNERLQAFLDYFVQTTHPGTILLDGDTASGRAYIHELARARDGRQGLNYAIYHDRYRRTADGWKFTERVFEVRYLDASPLAGSAPGPAGAPDVTQFPDMIDQLKGRYEAVCAAAGQPAEAADMTVVFDAGQNSEANFAHLARTRLHWIGSVPASDCPDLTALPASARVIVDKDRFGGLTAYDTRRAVYGAERRAILTHSPELHDAQAAGFTGTTLAKAGKKLDELAATLARGKTRRPRDKVQAEIEKITAKPWARRVIRWQLAGDQPKDLRLSWRIDCPRTAARARRNRRDRAALPR